MAKILAMLVIMIGLVIGANILAPLNAVANISLINVTLGYTQATVTMSLLLPLFFTVVLIVYAVKGIGE